MDQPLVPLLSLAPGTLFQLPDDPELGPGRQGTLIYATECRARVQFRQRGPRSLEVTAYKGTKDEQKFTVPNIDAPMDIAPTTMVIPIPQELS